MTAELNTSFWLVATGLGMLWHGGWIMLVGKLPRTLRSGDQPTAAVGSPEAFMLFWLDQYSWIGVALASMGLTLATLGALG